MYSSSRCERSKKCRLTTWSWYEIIKNYRHDIYGYYTSACTWLGTGIHTLQQKTITKHNAWVKYICTCSILWLSIQNINFNIIFAYPCFFLSFSTICSKNKKKKIAEITQENWKKFVFSLSPPPKKNLRSKVVNMLPAMFWCYLCIIEFCFHIQWLQDLQTTNFFLKNRLSYWINA